MAAPNTLVCTIQVSKTEGVTVTLDNATLQIKTTLVLDGASVVTTVKGPIQTSVITQKSESIDIKCKDFTLTADTITLKSNLDSSWTSSTKLNLKSTQDMTLTSLARWTTSATTEASLSAASIEQTAKTDFKVSATACTLNGNAKVDIGSAKVTVQGKAQVDVGAPITKVGGDGKLSLESKGLATLKGQLTQVTGSTILVG